jgi:hypothetical protein
MTTVNRDGFYLGDDVEVDGRDGIVDNLTYAGLLVKFNDNTMKWIPNGMATRIDTDYSAMRRNEKADAYDEGWIARAERDRPVRVDGSISHAPEPPPRFNPYRNIGE